MGKVNDIPSLFIALLGTSLHVLVVFFAGVSNMCGGSTMRRLSLNVHLAVSKQNMHHVLGRWFSLAHALMQRARAPETYTRPYYEPLFRAGGGGSKDKGERVKRQWMD